MVFISVKFGCSTGALNATELSASGEGGSVPWTSTPPGPLLGDVPPEPLYTCRLYIQAEYKESDRKPSQWFEYRCLTDDNK